MNLQELKAAYLRLHWQSIEDVSVRHVHRFVEFVEAEMARAAAPAEPVIEQSPAADPVPADGAAAESKPAAETETPAPDAQPSA